MFAILYICTTLHVYSSNVHFIGMQLDISVDDKGKVDILFIDYLLYPLSKHDDTYDILIEDIDLRAIQTRIED